ncbi:MAG: DUF4242 domain-containing protein [Gaiellales bacterium]
MAPVFVVERYLPGISRAEAEEVIQSEVALAAEMAAAGCGIRVVRATLVEGDETVVSFVEADSREDVVALGRRAGAPADRVVQAVEMNIDFDPGAARGTSP